MKKFKTVAAFGIAILAIGACGSDVTPSGQGDAASRERTAEEQAYVDDATAMLRENSENDDFSADQLECWVGEMVDGLGVDTLNGAGITPKTLAEGESDADLASLPEEDRKLIATSFTDCVDLEQLFTASLTKETGDVPPEMQDCLADVDWDSMESAVAEAILSGNEEMDEDTLMGPLMECMFGGLGEGDAESVAVESSPSGG